MKSYIKVLIFFAIALIMASCAKDEFYSEEPTPLKHTLSVGIESGVYQAEVGTKATTEAVVRATWAKDDAVSVINVSTGYLLGGQLKAESAGTDVLFKGTINGTLTNGDKLVYIYPAIKANSEEEEFATCNIDLSEQTYNSSDCNVVFYGYAEDTYSSATISKSIRFNLATSYVHLNMADLTASTAVTGVAISNINGGLSWAIESGVFKVNGYKANEGINVTCSNITSSANGNAIVRFAVPASDAVDERTLTVNDNFVTDYIKSAREAGCYYNQLFTNFSSNAEVSISKTDETTLYTTLADFRDRVNNGNNFSGYTVTVLKDIDLTDDTWSPIGTSNWSYNFGGIFDGGNHKITLVKTEIAGDYGLFNCIKGVSQEYPVIVRNLTLDINLVAKSGVNTWIGGLADVAAGYVQFENVTVTGNLTTGKFGSGFIGWTVYPGANCVFENCINKANITAVIPSGGEYSIIGGICSQAGGSSVSFINCRNEGVLTADHSNNESVPSYIGHMAGKGNYGSDNALTMTDCTYANTATISGWDVKEGDSSTYPFEGYMTPTQAYTYGSGTPNPGKLMIGGYFTSCNLDGTVTQFIYPNGNSQN